jgi:GYF domain 2
MTQGAWYYLQQGTPVGPCTTQELWDLRARSVVDDHTHVWQAGMDSWMPFRQVVPPAPVNNRVETTRRPDPPQQAAPAKARSQPFFQRGGVKRLASILAFVVAATVVRAIVHQPTQATESKIDQTLQDEPNYGNTYRIIKTNFPDDYHTSWFPILPV